jgi:hypothetical protein
MPDWYTRPGRPHPTSNENFWLYRPKLIRSNWSSTDMGCDGPVLFSGSRTSAVAHPAKHRRVTTFDEPCGTEGGPLLPLPPTATSDVGTSDGTHASTCSKGMLRRCRK